MKPVMLIILDGLGLNKDYPGNAVKLSHTPTLDKLFAQTSNTQIMASGEYVGLPAGQMGNSEVGHLNIGAGRVIYQDLTKITAAIKSGIFDKNPKFKMAMDNVNKNNSSMHLIGLLSKGGVHSHMDHLIALVKLMKKNDIKKVYIHAITDGRDVSPFASRDDIKEFENELNEIGIGEIATISGRYFAMDRDNRWERTEKYYNNLTSDIYLTGKNVFEYIESSYDNEITDEFLEPAKFVEGSDIKTNDSVIFFNFRPDRARQITRAITDEKFTGFIRQKINDLVSVTMTEYDKTITNKIVAFEDEIPEDTLGEVLEKNKIRQLRIAETEKYAHVTFFFNGGREVPFEGEDRILVPSPKVATYDLKPEMSAEEVSQKVREGIASNKYGVIILNFANPDMVGHTGDIDAAIKAVETVDRELAKILDELEKIGGVALITADHGNCEYMLDDKGNKVTRHSTNPVPLFVKGMDVELRGDGALCDIAPTILDILDIQKPEKMTGKTLISRRIK